MSLSQSVALPLPAELEVLEILWCRHWPTAKELHGVLAARRSISYRAVKTILTLMQAKGLVEKNVLHQPVTYQAAYSRSEFQQFALSCLAASLFQGDMSRLFRAVLAHPQLEDAHKNPTSHSQALSTKQVN